ncbi:hypothetical protein ES708_21459 [subsurface metagenome]
MAVQMAFPFLQEIDYESRGVATIEGWPVLNQPTQSGWIHRRWYWGLTEALDDAIRASRLVSRRLYVVQVNWHFTEKDPPAEKIWAITAKPPFSGVIGAFYCPQLDYYVVVGGTDFFVPGESPEIITRKKKKAEEEFNSSV